MNDVLSIGRCNNYIYSIIFRPWDKDRYFAPDIEAATNLLRENKVELCIFFYK